LATRRRGSTAPAQTSRRRPLSPRRTRLSPLRPYDLAAADYRRLAIILRRLAGSAARPLLVRLGLLRGGSAAGANDAEAVAALVTALEQLGPTFVKLGQIMATRADLLPPALTEALARLHDQVAPLPLAVLRPQLEADLGAAPETLFADFAPTPLAAASIAQVHAATLRDGRAVVVKIQRPGIAETMRADLRLLMAAARIVERRAPALRRHQPVRVVAELGAALLEELDFRIEAANQAEIARHPQGFLVPAIHPAFTTARTLVAERVFGQRPDPAFRAAHPALARRLAPEAARGLLGMMLLDGVFHADPHPGNLLVTADGRLALLDYGSVGRLSARRRAQVLVVLGSLVEADAGAVADVLLDWAGRAEAPPPGLEASVERFLARTTARRDLNLAEAITEFIGIARAHDLTLPPDLVLLMRALALAEGLARRLDPEIDIIGVITPVVMQAFAARFAPRALARSGLRLFRELDLILGSAPEALRRVLGRLRREGLTLAARTPDLAALPAALARGADRLALCLLAAALCLAGALVAGLDPTTPLLLRRLYLAAPLPGLLLALAAFRRR
jgi:ubiquinone biosynthesis protein